MNAGDDNRKDFSLPRPQTTIVVGALIAILGISLFLAAHAISTPSGVTFTPSERDLHEILWAAFGTAMMLGGLGIVAVGLLAWCRNERT